ncbi:1-phosphatidylinositol-3-phosphate 5-kinase FAB1B [Acorus calamus]|uniref:1-phosphatidylinositol-3-phosphate 5-kinase n=1 Tax=Acorus calamus TaxID=4465 RepID=A0AAV9ELQ0_ACOCL|nr:1-phosphatidylinositol-3-phosphate 5-kinase FAB1B [Acorus calamus]
MENQDKNFAELVKIVRSWIPGRSEPPNLSRDFWMPDHSCRVCYECDAPFTIFNRRHHCRLCGRVFCAKCTSNSVPIHPPNNGEGERIRVCNYCFKQWEQESTIVVDNGMRSSPSLCLSPSPSTTSLASSTKSGETGISSGIASYSTGGYQRVSPRQTLQMEPEVDKQGVVTMSRRRSMDHCMEVDDPSPNQYGFCMNRSDDEDEEYSAYHSDSLSGHFLQSVDCYGNGGFNETDNDYGSHKVHPDEETGNEKDLSLVREECTDLLVPDSVDKFEDGADQCNRYACDAASSIYGMDAADAQPVDFENNGLLWFPPEPEDEEDDREALLFDDEDDDEYASREWGCLQSSNSFGGGEYRARERSNEEHKKAMKHVVEHFRALVAQLLMVENLPVGEEGDKESWLEIITSLSWEAATILKPDTSRGGGMDPGGYVKIKCVACGRRSESSVVKGVVCKKNVAHRRMISKIEKPRFLILGGALEYQRVTNQLSSLDTLLQQEMDHLKMAVAKIHSQNPDVVLVEKSVSRHAQEYLLAKDISLVLNIKRPLLERVARCTGAQIVHSIDNLSSQKLGYCNMFRVEKFFEEHGSAGQGGKKLVKTLMFFEECPKPLGCTILLKGASGDELKKVKQAVQYGVFAAYHLALETSFLADEGASLPELPLKSPITVTLPDKPCSIQRSISTVPGFNVPGIDKLPMVNDVNVSLQSSNLGKTEVTALQCTSERHNFQTEMISSSINPSFDHQGHQMENRIQVQQLAKLPVSSSFTPFSSSELLATSLYDGYSPYSSVEEKNKVYPVTIVCENSMGDQLFDSFLACSDPENKNFPNSCGDTANETQTDGMMVKGNYLGFSDLHQDVRFGDQKAPEKEEFPPSPSDHQSILVSLSTRCVWKGTVCERAQLFRIKYYGSFDKPLGRFLQDHLFDQSYRCRSCEMPTEAHVHCYTHRQGSLTISVKKLPEFLLPGERDGKIWMWHRCLRCPRTNGFPPATRRVVMSDAAWGLSFGKFLELSFSNHAAASRVASCGHSLHRDCLRFYGFGKMVACFRYASIDVHSVYLPPPKLDFSYQHHDWIQKEADEVASMAELLFSEVLNALRQIEERKTANGSLNCVMKAQESRHCIIELESLLQKEKSEFEESLQKVLKTEAKKGQPIIDILDISKLRRQLLFCSYVWDRRLVFAADLNNSLRNGLSNSVTISKEKLSTVEKLVDTISAPKPFRSFTSCEPLPIESKLNESLKRDVVVHHGLGDPLNPHASGHQEGNSEHVSSTIEETPIRTLSSMDDGNRPDPLLSGSFVRRAHSEGQFPIMTNLSDTLDAKWTGENQPGVKTAHENGQVSSDLVIPSSSVPIEATGDVSEEHSGDKDGLDSSRSHLSPLPIKWSEKIDAFSSSLGMPFMTLYHSLNKSTLGNNSRLDALGEYNPVFVSSFRDLHQGRARQLLPVGINDTVVPIYEEEATSIISYALMSSDYYFQMSEEWDKTAGDSSVSLPLYDSGSFNIFQSFDEASSNSLRSLGSTDDSLLSMSSLSGSRSSLALDPLLYNKALHVRVSFSDDGKVKYTVTCYYAKRFDALRRICCPFELDYVRSLSRCKKWEAQGGKSNAFFAKSLDDRFIIKQVNKTELESFLKFAPEYFKYLSESIGTGSPTCLAKILGIYQVTSRHLKSGKESRMDVLVMENLMFGRRITRLYDLKGSARSRYNSDSSGNNKVLLDQNLIESMLTSPIFVGNKAKRLLERAVWNDTSFLASIDVMDYSLLVGVDEEKHELVLGIIDFMRQYTWDKHLETWVKASGILGGPKNAPPTVISPKQYKKRFRKAMSAYFLMVPDQWSPPTIIPSRSQSDLCEENSQGVSLES